MRGSAIASTGRYPAAQTGAPKLRTQPRGTSITSCRVALTPATFHAQSRRSTNSVISKGRDSPTAVVTVPRAPPVRPESPSIRAPETVGPHRGQVCTSVMTDHTVSASTCIRSSVVHIPRRNVLRILSTELSAAKLGAVELNAMADARCFIVRPGCSTPGLLHPRLAVGYSATLMAVSPGRACDASSAHGGRASCGRNRPWWSPHHNRGMRRVNWSGPG